MKEFRVTTQHIASLSAQKVIEACGIEPMTSQSLQLSASASAGVSTLNNPVLCQKLPDDVYSSQDYIEGAAFAAKRKPKFEGH